jgi:integrase
MMARPATGQIVERADATGTVRRSLRFRAGGRRHTVPLGAVSRADAERELAFVMADVARGTWQPAVQADVTLVEIPTFHGFAEEWWVRNEKQLAPTTRLDYRWRLEVHLVPFFGEMRLDGITFDAVEKYIAAKLGEEKPLSARSINMTVTLLGAILERAVERELIGRNPARGRGRRVRERAPQRSYLDAAWQITALLDAAGELDRTAPKDRQHVARKAMIAMLLFAGLRIGELCALRWRDIDLAAGWITVGNAKTDAGRRKVKIRGALRDELLTLRGRHPDAGPGMYLFPTSSGRRQSADNFRARVLGKPAIVVEGEERSGSGAVARANKKLEADGQPPLPTGLTPHSLRRTFCSLLYALGEDPGTVMDEMGHTDPALALRVYRQAMRRGDDEKAALRALVEGADWANAGERTDSGVTEPVRQESL